jgi:ADP-ribosylation factor 1/2
VPLVAAKLHLSTHVKA